MFDNTGVLKRFELLRASNGDKLYVLLNTPLQSYLIHCVILSTVNMPQYAYLYWCTYALVTFNVSLTKLEHKRSYRALKLIVLCLIIVPLFGFNMLCIVISKLLITYRFYNLLPTRLVWRIRVLRVYISIVDSSDTKRQTVKLHNRKLGASCLLFPTISLYANVG